MLTAPPLIGDSHPGINISRILVGGDLGGAVAAVGTIVIVLIGLPEARTFFAAALAGGVLVAIALGQLTRRRLR